MASRKFSGTYILENADLILPDRVLPRATLAVKRGRIAGIHPARSKVLSQEIRARDPEFSAAPVFHVSDVYVAPSLVELHIHGCGKWGFEQIRCAGNLSQVVQFLNGKGVGCFVPTLLWDENAVSMLAQAILDGDFLRSTIPGIYLEGPFVNIKKRGGIQPSNITVPNPATAQRMISASRGLLRICTIAPELEGIATVYPFFEEAGILIALGHSEASLLTAKLPGHPFLMTHLFNAMTGIDHKQGGLANLAFSGIPDYVEINGDGIHVNETCLRLAARAISADSLILISDAVVGAGIPDGAYDYFGHRVISSERGVRYADSDVLMGSNKIGIDIVRAFVAQTEIPLWHAVRAMSLTPRTLLGMEKDFGSIEEGKVADIYLWDKTLEVVARPEDFLLGK